MRRMSRDIPTPDQIRRLMRATRTSQTELAAALGVSQATVSKWVAGLSPMRGVYWWVWRMDAAAEAGELRWPPPTFDELEALLDG